LLGKSALKKFYQTQIQYVQIFFFVDAMTLIFKVEQLEGDLMHGQYLNHFTYILRGDIGILPTLDDK